MLAIAASGAASAADAVSGISGMAKLNDDFLFDKEEAAYLVVHDAKNKWEKEQKPDEKPRFSVLVIREKKRKKETERNEEKERKKKQERKFELRVDAARLMGLDPEDFPSDLEALCAVPGKESEFLAAESGYHKGKFGRVFWINLKRDENSGVWTPTVRNVLALPKDVKAVEGMACLPLDDTSLLLVFGERGGGGSVPIGRLRWGVVEVDKDGGFARDGKRFKADRMREFLVWPVGQRAGKPGATRDISDLYFDAAGQLWGVGAIDRGNIGPFRSVVYLVGRFRNDGVEILSGAPKIYARVDGVKVEALTAGPDAARFAIGADDEAFGGLWRPLR